VAELIALSPAGAALPKRIGAVTLTEAPFAPMTGISPHAGEVAQVSAALEAAHGLALPGPGRMLSGAGIEVLWFGRNRWLLIGAAPGDGLAAHAALTDQSDAWVSVIVQGAAGVDVLARLVPVDLRPRAFAEGSVIRTELFHMPAAIARTGAEDLRVMCFRSMAGTLVHDLVTAAEAVAARG
jgi:sarcosine oxidase subunit gamma